MWEQLNRLYLDVIERRPGKEWILQSHDFFLSVLEGAYLFHGITDATMSHGEGWQFIQLGRYVERADTLTTLLETHFQRMTNNLEGPVEARNIWNGLGFLAAVSLWRLTAKHTRRKYGRCASPNSCC